MKGIKNMDMIKSIDFDSAFPETPSIIHDAVLKAHEDILKYERRKRFFRNVVTAAAACLLVIAGATVFLMRSGGENSDLITPPVLTQPDITIDMETPVFASKTDPYYHSGLDCESAYAESVELPLITAIEFEKEACPACASDLIVNDKAKQNDEKHAEDTLHAFHKDTDVFTAKVVKSDGSSEFLAGLDEGGGEIVYKADYFGGHLKVYAAADGYVCTTDPSPDDWTYRYALIGRREISAEEYYLGNNGPGIYAQYDGENKLLIASWGDGYETHVYYDTAIAVEIVDDVTGECAWYMTPEQYEMFINDGAINMTESASDIQPGMSALLEAK